MNVFSNTKKKSTEVNAALDSKHVLQSMSSKSNGTFSHMNGWRVRFWVKNSLGACITYQLTKVTLPLCTCEVMNYSNVTFPSTKSKDCAMNIEDQS